MAAIVVQPPSQTMTNTPFYPPVVARTRVEGLVGAEQTDYSYVFAMAVLLDSNGNVLEGQLGGTVMATGTSVVENWGSGGGGSSRSRSALYFVFPDLFVSFAGTYTIRIDVYLVDYVDPEGARLMDQAETRIVSVFGEQVAVERPSKSAYPLNSPLY